MLDNFICCNKFLKRVNDCKTTTSGVQSDHSAIHIKFKLTAIKLNLKRDALTIIDWGKNCTDTKTNSGFYTRHHLSLMEIELYNLNPSDETDYKNFNKLILKSATDTAAKLRSEDKG